ncbi:uncharacterized protein MAL13P1.304-like isoform X2 [Condylostylus longicornis]|uniref:uncharacterized protein MAL13P1.304-like isoform X2 n=1 Tax=Condylostylus longicornis TaxID=2530218 RepID=UPI00244E0B46|nr:uncharacterized protein MAL13P1.304-like isoform X2 [Condylostylus longicornis]
MDDNLIDEILHDSFDYGIKFSNKTLGELIKTKNKMMENTNLQLFKQRVVVKLTNILNDKNKGFKRLKTNLTLKNIKSKNKRKADKDLFNQENLENGDKDKTKTLNIDLINENNSISNLSDQIDNSSSVTVISSTNSSLESSSPNTVSILPKHNSEEFSGNISVKSGSQSTKGVKLNIKLPTTLQYMSNHMPLTIEVDLTKVNFSQCIEQHNDMTWNTSNLRSKALKRKKCSIPAQNAKPKINIAINKDTRSNNNLKQFYENFNGINEIDEENISDCTSVMVSNQLENPDENACQNPSIDTTSRLEIPNEIRLPVGSIITNENGTIIVSLPQNEKGDSNEDLYSNTLRSTIPEDALSSLLSTSSNLISNQSNSNEEISTTIQSNITSGFPETITEKTIINVKCPNKNVEDESGVPIKLAKSDLNAKVKYRNMPLLDDLPIDSDIAPLEVVQGKKIESDKKETKIQDNSSSTHKSNLTNSLEDTAGNDGITSNFKSNESLVLSSNSENQHTRKSIERKENSPKQDFSIINPHDVIDDFLSSAHQTLDFEPDDDTLSLCCSPNIFDDIDIPSVNTSENLKNDETKTKEKTSISFNCSTNIFDDIEISNRKLLEADTSKNDKILSKEKDEFPLEEDYSNFDIFGIPRAQNKSQSKSDNSNLTKIFKIPKLSKNSPNPINSQIGRYSSVTEIDNDPRPIRPCWPNNPTNIARPPPNYRIDSIPEVNDNVNKRLKNANIQIAQVFDKPCLDYLKNSCDKGTNCRLRHTFLDQKQVKERVLLFGEQHVISSYNFIKHHEKLFHHYFIVFCEIFLEKKQLNMLNKMIKDCVIYTEKLYYLRTLTKFLQKFGKTKYEALQLIFRLLEGIPNLDHVIIDMICDDDVVLYYLNILKYYLNSSYKFHTAVANKLSSIYLQNPNEELCKIILDISLNTAANFPNEIAIEKSENLITFLEKCQTMNPQY